MPKIDNHTGRSGKTGPLSVAAAFLAAVMVFSAAGAGAQSLLGSDQNLGSLPFGPPQVNPGLTDVDLATNYSYTEADCDQLLTDIGQEIAYNIQGQVVKATQVSDEAENQLGEQLAPQVAKKFGGKLDADRKWLAYVQALGRYLVSGVQRKGIKWHFHVISDDTVNAFAIPGGGIYIHTGMLRNLKNEAQLATVLAHEIKHVDLRHCIALYQVLSRMPEAVQNPLAFAVTKFVQNPYNPRIEADADRRGLELAYAFGYSPYQAVAVWEMFGNKYGEGNSKIKLPEAPKVGPGGGTLLGDVLGRAQEELDNITSSHPKSSKRACLLRNHTLKLQQAYPLPISYVGNWNYGTMTPIYKKQH